MFLYGDAKTLPIRTRRRIMSGGRRKGRPTVDGRRRKSRNFCILNLGRNDLVIDALFGTGLTRAFESFGKVLRTERLRLRSQARPGLALYRGHRHPKRILQRQREVSGHEPQNAHVACGMFADLTVAFHRAKRGHFMSLCDPKPSGSHAIRSRALVWIRSGAWAKPGCPGAALHDLPSEWRGTLGRHVVHVNPDHPDLSKRADHKYSHGHALVLSGGPGKTGAARLAARGALRIGAGLVTDCLSETGAFRGGGAGDSGDVPNAGRAAGLAGSLEDKRLNALCLGPGMGLGRGYAGLGGRSLEGGATGRPCWMPMR